MHELKFGKPYYAPTSDELADEQYAKQMSKMAPGVARALGLCPEHWDDLVKNAEGTYDCPSCMREDFHEIKP
jgi:hypothetical protein